jgi:hypothetical protein
MSARKHNCEAEIQREFEEFEANVDGPDRGIETYQRIVAEHDDCPQRGCPPEAYNSTLHRLNHPHCKLRKA